MLDSLRNIANTWLGKLLIGFLIIGVAGFGISGVLTSVGSNTVARVGSQEISVRDFQRAYSAQLNNVASRTGSVPSSDEALAMGIPSGVINQLASDAALDGIADRYGLGVSDQRLGKLLREDPNFSDVLGQFDRQSFQQVLQMNGFTETEYLNNLRDTAERQQLVLSAFSGVHLPDTALEMFNHYASDQRTIEYFTLTSDYILPPAEPTDEEIAAYLSEHQSEFRTPPTRVADVTVLTPELIAEGIEVSDEEIAAEYERTKQGLVQIETRDIRQAALSDEETAEMFESGRSEGKSFDELVEETGVSVTDLGTLTQAEISDNALAEAAFSLEEGAFAVIPSAQGSRAVTVSNIVEGRQLTLDEARDQLIEDLRMDKARDQYIEVLDQIEELRAAFRPIDEIAERFNLPLESVEITASGEALSAVEQIPADGRPRVASQIFDAEMGDLAPTVALSSNMNVWFDLTEIVPARDQTVDEVRDEIAAAIMEERTAVALETEVETILAELDAGNSVEDVAIARNLFPEISQPFDRTGEGAQISARVADAAFGGPLGHTGAAQRPEGGYVVFEVTGVTPADSLSEEAEQARPVIQNTLRDNLYSEFVTGLRNDAGVSISQNTLSQVLALDTGN